MARTKTTARQSTGGMKPRMKPKPYGPGGFDSAVLADGSTFKIAARLGFDKFLLTHIYGKTTIFVPTDQVILGFLNYLDISLEDFEMSYGLEQFMNNLFVREHAGLEIGELLAVAYQKTPSLTVVEYDEPGYSIAVQYLDDIPVPVYDEYPLQLFPFVRALRGIYSTPELNDSYKIKK